MLCHVARLGRWLLVPVTASLLVACGGTGDAPPTGVQPTTPGAVVNLLRNPGLDTAANPTTPLAWTRRSTGSPAPTFVYPVVGRNGNAAAVTLTSRTSGEARWQHESVAITAGTVYTVSFWYRSTTASGVSVEYNTAGGSSTFDLLDSLPSTNGVWTQYTSTFTPPTLRTRLSVYHWINTPGTLAIDDAWLATGRNGPPASTTPTTPGDTTTPAPPPPPLPTITIAASPSALTIGQPSTLTWTSTNTTACTASGAWSGTKALGGNEVVTPIAVGTASYTLTCSGAGGSAIRSAVVTVNAPPPPAFTEGLVSFTLDDAWESQYLNALPILQTAGFKATFFIPTEPVQQGWNLFMSPAMILDLVSKGHEIGGHTVTHPDLTTLTPEAATNEINQGRDFLRSLIGRDLTSFAYPFGRSNPAVRELVRGAGFTSARGVSYATQNTPTSERFDQRALCYDKTISVETIKEQIRTAKANRSWFILCLHEVRIGGDEFAMTPAIFQDLVDFIRQEGVKVVTIAEGRALSRTDDGSSGF